MCKNLKVDTSAVEKICAEWDTIIASVSSAKRNGVVTNRVVFIKRDDAENDIRNVIKGEKVTNMEFGTVTLHPLDIKVEDEPASLQLIESLSNGIIGRVKLFHPKKVEDVFVYELVEEHNLFLENKNK